MTESPWMRTLNGLVKTKQHVKHAKKLQCTDSVYIEQYSFIFNIIFLFYLHQLDSLLYITYIYIYTFIMCECP